VRTTATPRGGASAARVELARGRTPGPGVGQLRVSGATGLAARGRGGLGPQAGARAAAPVDRPAVRAVAAPVAPGGQGPWRRQRAVDSQAHRGRDSGPVWGALSSRPCLDSLASLGLEWPGAGATAHPPPRTDHGPVETLPGARDQKTPAAWEPTWPSWMRAACCSCRPGGAPGHRRGPPP